MARSHQVWMGNLSACMTEPAAIAYVHSLGYTAEAPYKMVIRPSLGDNAGYAFAVASWSRPEHAEYFLKHAKFHWPNGKYAVLKYNDIIVAASRRKVESWIEPITSLL